jgi:hypothetical protein
MHHDKLIMSRVFFVLPALFLTACTADSDVVRVGSFLYDSVAGSNEKVSRERAAAIPYATMGLEVGSSAQGLLILGTTMGDELDWFAGENLFVATRHGHVIRTIGLPYDLGGVQPLNPGSTNQQQKIGNIMVFAMDFPELGIFGARSECSRRIIGDENVEILGAPVATRHVIEHCEVQALKWKFDDDFWEDRTSGYVWRSRQHIHPKSPPITLEVLRPEVAAPN